MIKYKKDLIFTAIKSLVPKNKNIKIIYSSESAIPNLSSKYFGDKKYSLNKNTWHKKNNLIKDYKYICSLSEQITVYLTKKLKEFPVKLSTIARGIPIGGDLEYTDEITLGRSIVGRVTYE